MSLIMTRRGWRQLNPSFNVHSEIEMQVWQRVSYSFADKRYIPDEHGELKCIDFVDYIEFAPPTNRGQIPSLEAMAYIRRCEQASAEWAERRASREVMDVEDED